ncbi:MULTISPECIES: hypothetical protein [Streptomyces rochei group]|uniref:hypothetical protein n=1 Tax=Streptomyces rochei group TaxID=2867164 RepID=UPI001875B0F9|nr:hypothetical protein [Streptomyces vinaceusdrappus]GHC26940.1 hypothetical protein GCM10010308_49790 [Streptomyces vinaceusdrappus]
MTVFSTETSVRDVVDATMEMSAGHLLERLDCAAPTNGQWARTVDCGTVRVRIRVEVEPTGLTADQAAAAVIAGDENEAPEVRAAARLLLAGGPGVEAAVAVLAGSGPWPS